MTYNVIQSGSSGNAVLLNGCVLIDCGVSTKILAPFVRDLRLVLLTHGHCDHFRKATVKALSKQRPTLRWGCCEWMITPLLDAGVDARNIDLFSFDRDSDYLYPPLDLRVRPEKLTHNVPNCGYHLSSMNSADKTFYATDTGSLDGVEAKGYHLYLVEANHREEEIQARIAEKQARGDSFIYETGAAVNHLSYEKACSWLSANMGPDGVWVRLHEHRDRESRTRSPKWNTPIF